MHPDVRDLPPSAKFIYDVLDREGELTQQEIAEETYLPERTVREALSRLEDADAVESRRNLADARQNIYSLK